MRTTSTLALWTLGAFPLIACATRPVFDAPELTSVRDDLSAFVQRQINEHELSGVWIAVLDQRSSAKPAIWARGFDADGSPRDAETPHRVASISKLFTATCAMVLVRRGLLDLDTPIERYLPTFAPENPFGTKITLRHLLGHRSGIVRESPVGHYFDDSEPSLSQTVASLNDTKLVFEPGTQYKYSNPAIGVVGEVIAKVAGKSFEDAVRELVLEPLALGGSDFAARPDLVARCAVGEMWTYDGRDIATPTWRLGYTPAAELRSSTVDLVRFAASTFDAAAPSVLDRATLEAMWKPQGGAQRGCGLGWFVRDFEGHRLVTHNGAIYGTASTLLVLPDDRIAVAVIITKDLANDLGQEIAARALRATLAARKGRKLDPPSFPKPVGVEAARGLAGFWRTGRDWVHLYERDGELLFSPNVGVESRMRERADHVLIGDDVLSTGGARRLERLESGELDDGNAKYVRQDGVPGAAPDKLLPYLGEYGWPHNSWIVYEDQGELAVLIEWLVRDIPESTGPDAFRFPSGMYGGDAMTFERDSQGKVVAMTVGGTRFPRRNEPDEGGFRIVPKRDMAEILREARAATPPPVPKNLRRFDLVDLASLDPTLRFDIRYATTNNFLGTQIYTEPVAKLQRPAAEALVRVHRALAAQNLGLLIFDAHRPWSVTKAFWDATPDALRHFVANPAQGSRHNRGCAVDLTLFDRRTGEAVPMPSEYDEFTERAYPAYPGGTSRARHYREVLRRAMEAEGFTVYEHEWWHFDYRDWKQYPIADA